MKKIWIVLMICFSKIAVAEPVTEEQFLNCLKNIGDVVVEMTQINYNKSLDKTFTTKAKVQFKKDTGFIYENEDIKFISTQENYCVVEDGESVKKSLVDLPHFTYFKSAVDQGMNGDLSNLYKMFDVHLTDKYTFYPKISEMANWIEKIEVSLKKDKLSSLKIYYRNENTVQFKFKELSHKVTAEINC